MYFIPPILLCEFLEISRQIDFRFSGRGIHYFDLAQLKPEIQAMSCCFQKSFFGGKPRCIVLITVGFCLTKIYFGRGKNFLFKSIVTANFLRYALNFNDINPYSGDHFYAFISGSFYNVANSFPYVPAPVRWLFPWSRQPHTMIEPFYTLLAQDKNLLPAYKHDTNPCSIRRGYQQAYSPWTEMENDSG